MDEVYIVVMRGGYFDSVTICEPSNALRMAQQLRQGGRKVKIFRSREDYLTALDRDYKDHQADIEQQNPWRRV